MAADVPIAEKLRVSLICRNAAAKTLVNRLFGILAASNQACGRRQVRGLSAQPFCRALTEELHRATLVLVHAPGKVLSQPSALQKMVSAIKTCEGTGPTGRIQCLSESPPPASFATEVRWIQISAADIEAAGKAILQTASETAQAAAKFWVHRAMQAWGRAVFDEVRKSSVEALGYDMDSPEAWACYSASLLKQGRENELWQAIFTHRSRWGAISKRPIDADEKLLEFILDEVTRKVTGTEFEGVDYIRAVHGFLLAAAPNGVALWTFLPRLYDRPAFAVCRGTCLMAAAQFGGAEGLAFVASRLAEAQQCHDDPDLRFDMVRPLMGTHARLPELREQVRPILRMLVSDEFEKVRAVAIWALCSCYPEEMPRAVEALNDRAWVVRWGAVGTLAGFDSPNEAAEDRRSSAGSPAKLHPLFTPDLLRKALSDRSADFVESLKEALEERRLQRPRGLRVDDIQIPPDKEQGEAEVEELASQKSPQAARRLLTLAADHPVEDVRESAVRALKDLPGPVDSAALRRMHEAETVLSTKEAIEDLAIAKGDDSLADLYLVTTKRRLNARSGAAEAFERLAACGSTRMVGAAIDLALKRAKADQLAKSLKTLLDRGLGPECQKIVASCLQQRAGECDAILAAGRIPGIPLQQILAYTEHPDFQLRARAWRAAEFRGRDGVGCRALRSLLASLLEPIRQGNSNAMWAALDIIDGILEFEGAIQAVPLLQDMFIQLSMKYPRKACWDRLRALGVNVTCSEFETIGPSVPYPWPSAEGPFFGCLRL